MSNYNKQWFRTWEEAHEVLELTVKNASFRRRKRKRLVVFSAPHPITGEHGWMIGTSDKKQRPPQEAPSLTVEEANQLGNKYGENLIRRLLGLNDT